MDIYDSPMYNPKFEFTKETLRAYKLHNGDIFTIDPAGMAEITGTKKPFYAGDTFMNGSHIIRVYYTPKKWWQFWKRKKVIAYKVMWHEMV